MMSVSKGGGGGRMKWTRERDYHTLGKDSKAYVIRNDDAADSRHERTDRQRGREGGGASLNDSLRMKA